MAGKSKKEEVDISFSNEEEPLVKEPSELESKVSKLENKLTDSEKEIKELEGIVETKNSEIKSLTLEIESLKKKIENLSKQDSNLSITGLFDELYEKIKDERVVTLLSFARENFARFKSGSFTEKEREEINSLFSEKIEGKVGAARKISKQ